MKNRIGLTLSVFVVISFFVLAKTVFFIGFVPTSSMEPTLKRNSIIIGSRLKNNPTVGDVIVFRKDGQLLVKRIVAEEGDAIEIEGIYYTVPNEKFLVMGDNEEHSFDSRDWDEPFINKTDIVALVWK